MKKRKKRSSKNSFFSLKYIIYILLLIIFSLSAFIVGILYTQKNYEKELKKSKNSIQILEKKIQQLKKSENKQKLQKETISSVSSEIMDYKNSTNNTVIIPPKEKPTPPPHINISKKPKLVIIIDDVSFRSEVKNIKKIPYKITPSFFPPTKRHPNTVIYAKSFAHYMVHVPMEAVNYAHPEPNTMNINWSYAQIKNRIDEIKKEFPKAKFINNHTGSTFTSDKDSMIKLFKALKAEHLGFVDSKTTPYSKSTDAEKVYHISLFERNIFLDNKQDPSYIRNQLKKAVKIAKKHGFAIAIGHPHPVTLSTLQNAKDILKNVDVVYIDELY